MDLRVDIDAAGGCPIVPIYVQSHVILVNAHHLKSALRR